MRQLALIFVLALPAWPAAAGDAVTGTYSLKGDGVTLTLVLEQSGQRVAGMLTGSNDSSLSLEGVVEDGVASGSCTGGGGQWLFEAELEDGKLILTLMELGSGGVVSARSLEFARASAASIPPALRTPAAPQAAAPPRPQPPPDASGDVDLLRYFAGEYYSFTAGSTIAGGSGTERTMSLCPDGTYQDSYGTSASGTGWGSAAESGGRGRWSMKGDRLHGVLRLTSAGGAVRELPYQVLDKSEGTIRFGGITFAFAGTARCP